MNRNTFAALLAATMVAAGLVGLAPTASAEACDPSNPGYNPANPLDPNGKEWYNYCKLKTATGPVSILVEKDIGLGLSICFTDPTFPVAPCAPNPGGVSSLGGAFFFVDGSDPEKPAQATHPDQDWHLHPGWDPLIHGGRDAYIWVALAEGSIDNGGFSIVACTDGDGDDICSGGNPADAQVIGFAGNGDDPCGGDDKDEKDCDSPREGEVHFCVKDDEPFDVLGNPQTPWDDFVIFIGAWEDTAVIDNPDNNNGIGATIGSFNVYAKYGNFLSDDDCDLENTSDQDEVQTVVPGASPKSGKP